MKLKSKISPVGSVTWKKKKKKKEESLNRVEKKKKLRDFMELGMRNRVHAQKNSLTMAADPCRVMMSLAAAVLDAIGSDWVEGSNGGRN